jgi:hypothetical protein
MTGVIGWELERALQALQAETGAKIEVERVLPPRGEPYAAGVWRVIRCDPARGRVTAALFPSPKQ